MQNPASGDAMLHRSRSTARPTPHKGHRVIIVFVVAMLMLFAALTASAQLSGTSGVVFVHGTGKQTDAYNDYWQKPFVDKIRGRLPNTANFLVINCDFNQYWWHPDAAGCFAAQTSAFIQSRGITDIYVITHSNGGNVLRWVMSNPTYDGRYPGIISRIRNVTAIAPSSAGTPLANAAINGNVFESAVGWLLGYKSDAVRQQQTDWMAFYNANYLLGTAGRPALPKTFKSIVGTDLYGGFWNPNAYCGGYTENAGLSVTRLWLEKCADGFIECKSANAAGSVWFNDVQRTNGGRHLSHNASRRDCFGLPEIIRGDL
jgi:hypothetical protein